MSLHPKIDSPADRTTLSYFGTGAVDEFTACIISVSRAQNDETYTHRGIKIFRVSSMICLNLWQIFLGCDQTMRL